MVPEIERVRFVKSAPPLHGAWRERVRSWAFLFPCILPLGPTFLLIVLR